MMRRLPDLGASDPVIYQSQGHCLILGKESVVLPLLQVDLWPRTVTPYLLISDAASPVLATRCQAMGIPWVEGKPVELRGHLGNFEIKIAEGRDLVRVLAAPKAFDLVLDLLEPPLLQREALPFGYFSPVWSDKTIERIVRELAEWVGEFEKPRYFVYHKEICAHGTGSYRGCQRCIEVCPAEAVVSVGEWIKVDPYLCQGCGDCATACPSGALNYLQPDRKQLVETLFAALAGSPGATVVFQSQDATSYQADEWITRSLSSVAVCGPEVWLALLAAGASAVRLQREGLTVKSQENLQIQIRWVEELLARLGYGKDKIGWLEDGKIGSGLSMTPIPPARFAALSDKREMLRLALAHLVRHAASVPEVIPLPQGAPLGGIEVDGGRCTLCMACVSICPVQALQAGGEMPELRLVEQNCLQCGLCAEVCPEGAIRLLPRLLTDEQQRRQPQLLHREIPFACLECGQSFATRRIIETILARVADHPMFADERRRRRLLLCEDCRVRDLMRDYE